MQEQELRELIKNAIGYDPVPLSIRDHPEIRSEFRTAEDRDGLVDRITAALLPVLPRRQETTWMKVDLRFRDLYSGLVRYEPNKLVEVVLGAPNQVLFQDEENGTHRMVATQHIEAVRTA